jgi:hypothetical protein
LKYLITLVLSFSSFLAFAQSPPVPYVQILGFNGTPGNCTSAGAALLFANMNHPTGSSTFTLFINGAPWFVWPSFDDGVVSNPQTYGVRGNSPMNAPANATITATITTYSGLGLTGSRVYTSTISWNCTTQLQVGSVVNTDLRVSQTVPVNAPLGLALMMGLVALLARARLSKQ